MFVKFSILAVGILSLSSCKSNDPESSDRPKGESQGNSEKESLYELQEQLRKIETKHPEVYEDPEVIAASKIMTDLYSEYNKTRAAHPEVKPLYDQQNADQNEVVQAQVKGDESARKAAMKAFADSRAAYEKKSLEVKDLDPLRDRLKQAEQDYNNTRYKFLKNIPEAKALVEKIEGLSK